jgi:hypothetical protein
MIVLLLKIEVKVKMSKMRKKLNSTVPKLNGELHITSCHTTSLFFVILKDFLNLKACILILTTTNTSNIEIIAQTKVEKYRESLRPVLELMSW